MFYGDICTYGSFISITLIISNRKAKYIVDTYQPLLAKLNSKLETFDLIALQNLAATCAVQ